MQDEDKRRPVVRILSSEDGRRTNVFLGDARCDRVAEVRLAPGRRRGMVRVDLTLLLRPGELELDVRGNLGLVSVRPRVAEEDRSAG